VVVVILDGLRADAIPLFGLPVLGGLASRGAATFGARTVSPSITNAALTSLLTGVGPAVHGLASDRIALPPDPRRLTPLPKVLRAGGVPTLGFRGGLPFAFRGIGKRIAQGLGAEISFGGSCASEILDRALPSLGRESSGMWLLHWPDADTVGHASGWSSQAYLKAALEYDVMVGRLLRETGALRDPGTVLILLADHGGGGRVAKDHASDHPLDTSIPLIIAGGQVRQADLGRGCSLLDVPATIPWLFGLRTPSGYQGRILREAFLHQSDGLMAIRAAA